MTVNEDKFIQLIETITENSVKLDTMVSNFGVLEERMMKLEALREQDIRQNEKIEHILLSLKSGSEHFSQIDKRLDILEKKDGENAKGTIRTIGGMFIAAIVGAIISNIGNIISSLGG